MTAKQRILLNKGMYISLGLVVGMVVFAFTFGGEWTGLQSKVNANTENITNIDAKLDRIDQKVDAGIEKTTETNNNVIRLQTLVEQK